MVIGPLRRQPSLSKVPHSVERELVCRRPRPRTSNFFIFGLRRASGRQRRTAAAVIPLSLRWHYHRSAFVLNQEHDKFRWFSIARVPANDMNIVGTFIEALTRC